MKTRNFIKSARILLPAFLLAMNLNTWADHLTFSGNIATDTTWSGVDSILVTGNITINDGVTLTIDPGIVVSFQGWYEMKILGRLLAQGTEADSIKFTVADTTGYANNTYTGWKGIRFYQTPASNDTSRITRCIIEYVKIPDASDYAAICAYCMNKLIISENEIKFNKKRNGNFWNSAGIMCRYANIIIRDNYIHDNESFVHGCIYLNYSNPQVTGNKVCENRTFKHAWGICENGSIVARNCTNITIRDNIFSGNYCEYTGGAILILGCDNVNIINNRILNNTCERYGGGICLYDVDKVKIIGNLLVGNVSNGTTGSGYIYGGGGICLPFPDVVTDSLLIINNTITQNEAYRGGGICINRQNLGYCLILNNIIYGNSADLGGEIYLRGTQIYPDPIFRYNFLGGGIEGIGVEIQPDYSGEHYRNFDLWPGFTNSGDDPYSPAPVSFCTDAGSPGITGLWLPETDLIGNDRIYDICPGTIDIGAYESQSAGHHYILSDTLESNTVVECRDTVHVIGDFVIPDGKILSIQDADHVLFTDYNHFTIDGCFTAEGTESNPIHFAPFDTTGYGSGTHPCWPGLVFDETPSSNPLSYLNYCELNYAKATEPGIRESGGALFVKNTDRLRVEHCGFTGNRALDRGGAVYTQGSGIRLQNCSFTGNQASLGGAIAVSSDSSVYFGNVIVENEADSAGGAVYASGYVTFLNNTIFNNTAGYGGAFALYDNSDANLTGNIIWGNKATIGPTVYLHDATCDPSFYYNDIEGRATGFAGAGSGANFTGAFVCNNYRDPLFTGTGNHPCQLQPQSPCINLASYDTTGMFLPGIDQAGNPRFMDGRLDAGAYEFPGATPCHWLGGHISVDFTVGGDADTAIVLSDIIIDNGKTLTINPGKNVVFEDFYKLAVQGRLLAIGTESDSILFTVNDTAGYHNNTHTGWNTVEFDGTPATNDTSRFSYCKVEYGKGAQYGAAMNILGFEKVVIRNSLFRRNMSAYGQRGVIYIDEGAFVFHDNCLEYNKAGGMMLMAYHGNTTTISGCTFRYNSSSKTQTSCIQHMAGDCPRIIGNRFEQNTWQSYGGAIGINALTSDLYIMNNVMVNNEVQGSSGKGGGIYLDYPYEKIYIRNNVICNNSASQGGGAIYVYGNVNPQKSIYCQNNIITGNTSVTGGAQIDLNYDYAGQMYFSYCDLEGGLEDIDITGPVTLHYSNNLDTDPEFTGTGLQPWSLKATSPCINAGTPDTTGLNLPLIDIAGNPRIYQENGSRIEMGAYEYQGDKQFHHEGLTFDGVDDYVEMEEKVLLPGDYTIEAWFMADQTTIGKDILTGTVSDNHGILLEVRNDGKLRFLHRNPPGTTGGKDIISTGTYTDGYWHHLAAIKSGADISLYVDGIFEGSNTGVTSFTDSLTILVGKLKPSTSERFYKGQIDEIRLWNTTRDPEDIRDNMHRMITGTENCLVSYWPFNETTGTTLNDLTGNNDGTLYNMTDDDWITSTAPMPFTSIANGNWSSSATWDTGQGKPTNDWSRVAINSDVVLDQVRTVINLIVGPGHHLSLLNGSQLMVTGE
jgi:predicted outer membrane repeat protein